MEITPQRVEVLNFLLNEFIDKSQYYYGALAKNGKILVSSKSLDSEENLKYLVKSITSFLKSFQNYPHIPTDLLLSEHNRRIFIQRIYSPLISDDYLLIVCVSLQQLYFRRNVNVLVKKLTLFLS